MGVRLYCMSSVNADLTLRIALSKAHSTVISTGQYSPRYPSSGVERAPKVSRGVPVLGLVGDNETVRQSAIERRGNKVLPPDLHNVCKIKNIIL